MVRKAAASDALTTDQGRGLVDVIARYTRTFLLLQRYDEGLLVDASGHSHRLPGRDAQSNSGFLLECADDAEEVLGVRIAVRRKHPVQALARL
ncbi:MAG TPA: hypothetical protein VNK91_05780, partial [Burkholderiaceae bacterium]|nr:hypothetical protein [Burkholderiaceae bacterium]